MLRVWLPLDGDLKNLGCSSVEVTNNGATIDNSGKIGKCYHFGTSKSYIQIPKEAMTTFTTDCSVSFWLKINTWNSSYATFFQAGLGSNPWTHYIFGFLRNNTNSTICFTISNGSSASNASYLTSTIELNKWYHITLTYTTGKCKIYLNGLLDHEYVTSIIPNFSSITTITLGCGNSNGYQTDCNINDFRIYDHCLSAAEVHEIAQGLILHYKLDNNGWGNPNLHKNSYDLSSKWGVNQGSISNGIATITPTTNSGRRIYQLPASGDWTWQPNTTYSASIEARTDNNGQLLIAPYGANVNSLSFNNVTTNWKRFSYTFTTGDTVGTSSISYSILQTSGSTLQVRKPKLELSNIATPWCPNAADALYSTLGLGEAIVKDSSGYGHNGTITGNITTNSSTPRYNTSTNFPDSACSIGIGNLSTLIPEGIFTFNIWFKKVTDEWSSKNYETILGGPNGFELEGKNGGTNSPVIKAYSWGGSTFPYTLDEWHMLTMIRTTTDTKFYLDGKLKLVGSAGNIPSGDYFIGAWKTATQQNYRGYLSDARIYCTQLLDKDIKLLYNTSMRVDNSQGIHSFEFDETSTKNQLTKTGILKNNIIEPYITLSDGSYWKLMLFHYVDGGNNLFTSSNATYCNDFGLYSRLRDINNYTYNNGYEFYVIQDGKEFRWTQTSQPTASSIAGLTTVSGYNNPVNGLAKPTSLSQTYIGYGSWWGACGCWTSYSTGGKIGIPGFGSHDANGICTTYLTLYTRIEKPKAGLANSTNYANNFIEN